MARKKAQKLGLKGANNQMVSEVCLFDFPNFLQNGQGKSPGEKIVL